MKNIVLSIAVFAIFSSCSPESTSVYGQREIEKPAPPSVPVYSAIPQDEVNWITLDGGQSQLDFNPQVDILFLIDNSDSMKSAEANLVRNINRFVSTFKNNRMIDFHIGVISTWDSSERFLTKKENSYGVGELWNVKDRQGRASSARFVSSKDDVDQLLASTLNIGIVPFAKGGPETEEFFTPLAAALTKTGRGAANEGFFRPQAQLVTVILTDADDSSQSLSPEELAQKLFDFKDGRKDKVSVYAALVKKTDPDESKDWGLRIHPRYHPECFDLVGRTQKRNSLCKTGFGPDRLEKFVLAANADHGTASEIRSGHIMSLIQKDFGDDLAQIGSDISVRTLAKEIVLEQRPRQDEAGRLMLRVRYGTTELLKDGKGQLIPQQQKAGWVYNAENNSIKLSGDIKYEYQEGARFAIDMVPVTIDANN